MMPVLKNKWYHTENQGQTHKKYNVNCNEVLKNKYIYLIYV